MDYVNGLPFERYTRIIDGHAHTCWYRICEDGQVEVWARGQRSLWPSEALPLLPEPIAREVLERVKHHRAMGGEEGPPLTSV